MLFLFSRESFCIPTCDMGQAMPKLCHPETCMYSWRVALNYGRFWLALEGKAGQLFDLESEAAVGRTARDKVLLLNKTTEVINYWQEETKHTLEEAQAHFSDCQFQGQ